MKTKLLMALFGGLLCTQASQAANFDDLLKDIAQDNAEEYVQPLADAATIIAGSGSFHNGRSKGLAGLDLGVKLVTLPFATGSPEDGSIIGDTAGGLAASEASALALPMLTASKGLFKGIQVGARFMQLELSKDIGDLNLMGASARFELTELIPMSLVLPRISLQADWSQLKIGESIKNTTMGYNLIVSKSFIVLEPYAGLSMLQGKTDLDYTYELTDTKVGMELDSDAVRLAAGVNFTPFPLLKLNAEYAMADYNTFTVGLMFNLF